MAKGTESKIKLFQSIQKAYPDSFWEDEGKILRVPMEEGGNLVEIKVTLTAAKTNMSGTEPKSAFGGPQQKIVSSQETGEASNKTLEMTQEEKDRVAELISALGLC